jgi:prefoldin subunit 5
MAIERPSDECLERLERLEGRLDATQARVAASIERLERGLDTIEAQGEASIEGLERRIDTLQARGEASIENVRLLSEHMRLLSEKMRVLSDSVGRFEARFLAAIERIATDLEPGTILERIGGAPSNRSTRTQGDT